MADHGTYARYRYGCACETCRVAAFRYEKQRQLLVVRTGSGYSVPAWRALRRLQALQALGWSLPAIGTHAGVAWQTLQHVGEQRYVTRKRFGLIEAAYDDLHLSSPPTVTRSQRMSAACAKASATRKGYAPPLAWDDIDDPDEQPSGIPTGHETRHPADVDEAVVLRLLDGVTVPSTRAEKDAAMRRWLALGNTAGSLLTAHGWKDGRYGRGDVA